MSSKEYFSDKTSEGHLIRRPSHHPEFMDNAAAAGSKSSIEPVYLTLFLEDPIAGNMSYHLA
jgi:hypothetical protein